MVSAKIRVLVVDDSAVIRQVIRDHLSGMPDMEVVGMAPNGQAALEMLPNVRPDIVTLDVQMPKLDGLATLDRIMAAEPLPVVMVSTLTQRGADTALEALERGAVDYVSKPDGAGLTAAAFQDELARKIRMFARADVKRILELRRRRKERRPEAFIPAASAKAVEAPSGLAWGQACIAIGISTGGPPALARLFEALQPPLPPIVVVQHMPPTFTRSLAWRLDSLSKLRIKEAATGDVLSPNGVWLARGGMHLHLQATQGTVKAVVRDGSPVSGHRPSVDVMMSDAARIFGGRCLGVIMTGMGHDGVAGCAAIRAAGGIVLGQDADSSEVYGMNKVAWTEGHVDRQFGLSEAASVVTREIRRLIGQPVPAALARTS